MFDVGQLIYGIEVIDDDFENAEISGYLYMAECGNYIICCAEYAHLENDFDTQLCEMYIESIEEYGIELNLLKKEYVFETKEGAKRYLDIIVNKGVGK
jgi:hypothetical protein